MGEASEPGGGTAWSEFLAAGDSARPGLRPRLGGILSIGWRPVFRYFQRRWGMGPPEAAGRARQFFDRLFEGGAADRGDPESGRFRAFLKKRLRLAGPEGEEKPAPAEAEEAFDRDWATCLLEDSLRRLERGFLDEGRDLVYRAFQQCVLWNPPRSYRDCAGLLGAGEEEVRDHVRAARGRLREVVRGTIRESLARESDLEEEFASLLDLFDRPGTDPPEVSNAARFLRGRLLLGRLAVLNGFIREEELRACLQEQRARPGRPPLAAIMVDCGMLSEGQVAELLRQQRHLEGLDAAGGVIPAVPGADRLVAGRYALQKETGREPAPSWRAWDTRLQRAVTLLELPSGGAFSRELVLNQARAMMKLRHPRLVEVYETVRDQDRDYLVLGHVEGETLDRTSLPVSRLVELMIDLCEAVHAVHREGFLHRDIRPRNILVDAEGRGYLGGLAMPPDPGASKAYMAPELVSGDPRYVGPATDVYGLGATLYHALTGQPPFAADEDESTLILKLGFDAPVPPGRLNSAVPEDLEAIVLRALEKVPADRYVGAMELAEDLRRFLRKEKVSATLPEEARESPWRLLLGAAALAAGVVGLSGAVLAVMGRGAWGGGRGEYRWAYRKGIESWGRVLGAARRGRPDAAALAAAEEAAHWFGEAAGAGPAAPEPWLMKARCLQLLGREAEAAAAREEGLARDPRSGAALLGRGMHRLAEALRGPPGAARPSRSRAREDLERARRAGGLDPAERRGLEGAIALSGGRPGEAAPALEEYFLRNPWDGPAAALLAAAFESLGRSDRAGEFYRVAAALGFRRGPP